MKNILLILFFVHINRSFSQETPNYTKIIFPNSYRLHQSFLNPDNDIKYTIPSVFHIEKDKESRDQVFKDYDGPSSALMIFLPHISTYYLHTQSNENKNDLAILGIEGALASTGLPENGGLIPMKFLPYQLTLVKDLNKDGEVKFNFIDVTAFQIFFLRLMNYQKSTGIGDVSYNDEYFIPYVLNFEEIFRQSISKNIQIRGRATLTGTYSPGTSYITADNLGKLNLKKYKESASSQQKFVDLTLHNGDYSLRTNGLIGGGFLIRRPHKVVSSLHIEAFLTGSYDNFFNENADSVNALYKTNPTQFKKRYSKIQSEGHYILLRDYINGSIGLNLGLEIFDLITLRLGGQLNDQRFDLIHFDNMNKNNLKISKDTSHSQQAQFHTGVEFDF